MTTRNLQARLLFEGGWATDFGPSAHVSVGQDGTVRIPFLVDAENAVYDLDGGPRKIGGTDRVNSSALNSGATIRGLTDFWALGTGSSPTQHRVVHVGDELMKDDGDGTFASILDAPTVPARDTSAIPSYAIFDDDLIIMSDVTAEVPLRWDGTGNASTLGTNTPNCAFGVTHKNRFWMAGDLAKKSRLYYSEPLPNGANGNWDQVEAGFIDIDPDDGDEIRGVISHKGILWVFKGPYFGSIHRIAGDTPLGGVTAFAVSTQPQPFELDIFVRGLGAAGQNSIFRFRDDIGFIDAKTGSIRSLNATAQFGDFREAALSFPINNFLRDRVNKTKLKGAWAVQDVSRGGVTITIPIDGNTTNNTVLYLDYRFDPVRWSIWPAVIAESLASVIDTTNNNLQSVFIGDTDGFMRRTNVANRSIDETTTIGYKVTMPYLDFGNPVAFKTFARGSVGIAPRGSYSATFGWTRDNKVRQTTTFTQGGGDVLAGTVVGGASRVILVATDNSPKVTFTTFASHGLSVGERIAIQRTTPDYNGVYSVVAVGAVNKFDVTTTFLGDVSDSLGGVRTSTTANFFALGTSTLGGGSFIDRFFSLEEGGEFRSIQFDVRQGGLNEDIEMHSIFVELEIGADSTEN
jgi:hypothetical protein